jgi:hypothetical protein
MAKLTHCGWGACAKGDGLEFKNWMEDLRNCTPGMYPNLNIGRAELSKRQDWSLEAPETLYPIVKPLLK